MENLIKELKDTSAATLAERIARYDADPTGNDGRLIMGRAKPYAGTPEQQRAKVVKKLQREVEVELSRKLAKVEDAKRDGSEGLPNPVIIRIDWTRNRTWGATAKASDNYGHVSDVASGCGYDKASTALAGVLNQIPQIMYRLYREADKAIKTGTKYRQAIGYGSGYSVLPYFEGGVGVSSHVQILERLGYKVAWSGDVVVITEK